MGENRFFMPTRLICGEYCVRDHAALLAELGQRCLIVTGTNSARASGALKDVTDALENQGIRWTVYDKVEQNPRLASCAEAAGEARRFGAQFVIGIGGGSPLDAAKAIAALAANNIPPEALYKGKFEKPLLPIVLVGTTAGTGSEVTQYAVITDPEGRKRAFASPQSFAKIAFGDPRYTAGLSERFTVSTALDALTHLIEGYFNRRAGDASDLFAVKGIALICRELADVRGKAPGEIAPAQREALYRASVYGGIVIANTGTCFCHSLGYFLTERHDVPHGIACAVYLPEFIARGEKYMEDKARSLSAALGMSIGELSGLVRASTDFVGLTPDAGTITEIAARYEGSGNYLNSPGGFSATEAEEVMRRVFD
jgi:alcohol dehydrogenase class IV